MTSVLLEAHSHADRLYLSGGSDPTMMSRAVCHYPASINHSINLHLLLLGLIRRVSTQYLGESKNVIAALQHMWIVTSSLISTQALAVDAPAKSQISQLMWLTHQSCDAIC